MKWVTRHNPHVDRCASIWLIKTFIDKDAVFYFISRDDLIPEGAIPFTLPGAELRPKKGKTTFDALVEKYNIKDPVVAKIQEIIRDAEQAEETGVYRLPESAGVFAILRGLDRISKSDWEIIGKAMIVMDSLYAELKHRLEQES
ncbi:MAG: chromate resistance protein [archaeon GB-1867-035]|nr:chromate resistance protein [Candidatus Culexmicrobium profundum]